MTSIPSNLTRVPNLLASQLFLSNLTTTNLQILRLQEQMATGRAINRPSDNPVRAGAVGILDATIERSEQRLRNLSLASATLGYLDSSIGEANDLVIEAAALASSQIGATSDGATRNNQAIVVDSMIRELFLLSNRETNGVHVFGGSTATRPPMEEIATGFRYVGRGSGLIADLDLGPDVPITIGGDNAIGETSARLISPIDLDPVLTADTAIDDLDGGRGLGVSLGTIEFSFDGGPVEEIDLSEVATVGDVVDAINAAIIQYETDNGVTILDAGGVSIAGGSISIDVVGGAPNPDLVFSDIGAGTTGEDLGLIQAAFNQPTALGADLDPRVTLQTPVSALPGVTTPLGEVRFDFRVGETTSSTLVDLSGAQTVDDIRSIIESEVEGVRVEVNESGRGLAIFNEVSGPTLTIADTSTLPQTAFELGIRTFTGTTPTGDLNNGEGVRIATGAIDPITGLPDPDRDIDFLITLGTGQSFSVDLREQDLATVQTVVDRINAEFTTALGEPPINGSAPALVAGDVWATVDSAGGLALVDTGGLGQISVERENNSPAAGDLGLESGAWDAGGARFVGEDRAGIRVDSLFTHLIALRDALRADDTDGITLAGGALQESVDRLAEARALAGVYASRVETAERREEDLDVLDRRMRSELQDLDFTEAAVRFNLLQTQLQAGLQTGARAQSLSLLDFLG